MLTTREVIKTFYNALLQRLKKHRGDWNQNNPTADDYIKNRPFYTDDTKKIVKLDRKYLPDLGLAPVATSGNYYDLEDAPTVYSDVVRYNVGQNLSRIQKEQARENIGAISSDEVTGVVKYTAQSLTDTQKAQARTNIGAGTSNFDGAYSSLTGAPRLAAVATSGSYGDLSDAPKLTDIYGENIFTAGEAGGYESVTYKGREYKYVGDLNDTVISKDKKGIVTVWFTSSYAQTSVIRKYKLYRDDYTATGDGVLYFSQLISDKILYSFSSTSLKDVDFDVMFAEASKSKRLYMYCSYPYGHKTKEYKLLESTVINESYIPSTIQRTGDPVILTDTNGAKWRLIVDDSGALTTEAVTE